MFSRLAALFIIIPLLELYILIQAGSIIGGWNTVFIVIITGITGAAFAKSQGITIINNIQGKLSQGQIPGNEMVQGILILAGGLTLLTPGFITDLAGLTLLIPWTRKLYAGWLISYFGNKIKSPENNHPFQDQDPFTGSPSKMIEIESNSDSIED